MPGKRRASQETRRVTSGKTYRFDPVDLEQMRLVARIPPAQRMLVALDAHELVVAAIRGRLSERFPDLSPRELGLKVLEEVTRGERRYARS